MKWLFLALAVVFVCVVVTGCSTPPQAVHEKLGVRNEVAVQVPPARPGEPARPGAAVSAESARISSETLPPYEPVAGLAGKIASIGDSTATNLVARAAAEFRRIQPEVKLQVTAALAGVGLAALLEGRADIVPMSRALTPEEVAAFQLKFGYPPTQIKVAADALAIYVEKSNPVPGLKLAQLDGIFSRTQRRGGGSIETWGQESGPSARSHSTDTTRPTGSTRSSGSRCWMAASTGYPCGLN